MKKKFVLIFIVVCFLVLFKLLSQGNNDTQYYRELFDKAEILFNGSATDSTDSIALHYYTNIISGLKPGASNAMLLYNCHERAGLLKQGFGYPSQKILQDYYAALFIQKLYRLNDSILFRLLLSAGNVHYANAMFDSSVYYFTRAESIIDKYPAAGLAGDLYNSLGAVYNEAGNYMQSGIYFSKALELTKQNHPELNEAIFAMSANIASAVRSSGYPDSALLLYKNLLNIKHPSVAIVNNIAGIYLIKKQPDSALHYLKIADKAEGNYGIAIHNAMAQAFILKLDTAKANDQLQVSAELYTAEIPTLKNNYYAATQKYFGDLMMMEKKPLAALSYYQQAIIQYDFKFNDNDVFVNPGNFIGEFTSYNLFDALTAKANCFAVLYHTAKEINYFKAAIDTYDSAFALSDYIKKSIDNDEARLFIADKVFSAYISAVDFLLGAYQNPDEKTLIHALGWISKSRATSLAINLKENNIRQYAGLPDSLLQNERKIKINISRMKLQLQQSRDTAEQTALVSAINTALLQLQLNNNAFKNYKDYYRQKFAADTIDIQRIQKNVLDKRTAAICYFKGAGKFYIFVIGNDKISVHEVISNAALHANIGAYINQLAYNNAGEIYNRQPAQYLYKQLFKPVLNNLKQIKSLVIIPDQDLINIPFEAFEAEDNRYLVQDYAVTYQYALPLLQVNNALFNINNGVAFAPFAYNAGKTNMNVLPSSINEISGFSKSTQIIDRNATKDKFIAVADKASVIHLATHAAVNFKEPENSYIAFYGQNSQDLSYKMFAHELYNLQLPHTQFVFLSACETGSGKLSQSEGALSLSRAFAFAGCPDIVTSLWKAEDKSTAYISEKFYDYVAKGYSYAYALQKAKTNLITEKSMSQFHSPVYWSHLVFIGDVQQEKSFSWKWIFIVIIACAGIIIWYVRKKAVNP